MILETIPDVNRLTAAEKLPLVNELLDDLAAQPADVPVSRERLADSTGAWKNTVAIPLE